MVNRRPEDETVLLPNGVTQDLINYWENLGFDLCYLPAGDLRDENFIKTWREKPGDFFYRLVTEGRLSQTAATLSGRWLLVDGRDKPKKSRPWLSRGEFWLVEKFGWPVGKILRARKTAQVYQNDFLSEPLMKLGAASRFCLSIEDIQKIIPAAAEILKLDSLKVRLPTFAEYLFLGNFFYSQWSETETWEWLADPVGDRHLAAGSRSLNALGLDPIDYWSTILGFRFVVEL